jgi:hypothetical protein
VCRLAPGERWAARCESVEPHGLIEQAGAVSGMVGGAVGSVARNRKSGEASPIRASFGSSPYLRARPLSDSPESGKWLQVKHLSRAPHRFFTDD